MIKIEYEVFQLLLNLTNIFEVGYFIISIVDIDTRYAWKMFMETNQYFNNLFYIFKLIQFIVIDTD